MTENEVAVARQHRGYEAWQRLEELGGIWPESFATTEHWQEFFWPGMGEYGFDRVQDVLHRALPKVDAKRAWPWVAAAAFGYESERSDARLLAGEETNSNRLVEDVARHASGLADALMALDMLLFQSPVAVGQSHWQKVARVATLIDASLGGPTTGASLSTGRTSMQSRLLKIAEICNRQAEKVGQDRKRTVTDVHLPRMTMFLAMFWVGATGRRPSAAKPCRKDGMDGPFVRLVDGCARLGGGHGASRKQVATILKNVPKTDG